MTQRDEFHIKMIVSEEKIVYSKLCMCVVS